MLSDNKESDIQISNVDHDLFDEANNTVHKYIENIQLNWKSNTNNVKCVLWKAERNSASDKGDENDYKNQI